MSITAESTIYGVIDEEVPQKIAAISYDIAHQRYGHPGKGVLGKFPEMTKNFPKIESAPSGKLCPGCAQGKMHDKSHPTNERRATKLFELVHSDLKSFPTTSYHKYQYMIVFYDDFSGAAFTTCLRTKDAALSATKEFLAMVENQFSTTVKTWMSDAGGEYKSEAFSKMLREKGIKILTSAPHTPQQNGRAERFMRTMMDKAEALRFTAYMPES